MLSAFNFRPTDHQTTNVYFLFSVGVYSPQSLWFCKFQDACQNPSGTSITLGTVHLIFWGGGGLEFFRKKKFLALILAEKNNLAQWHYEKQDKNNMPRSFDPGA